MKIFRIIVLLFLLPVAGCKRPVEVSRVTMNCLPEIFPDYRNVTVPYNIAPLNFSLDEPCQKILVSIKGISGTSSMKFKGEKVIFSKKIWEALLKENMDSSIEITVSVQINNIQKIYNPFKIFIKGDAIDGYLVYRLIMPGFQNWNQMGIYQRSLSDFKVETIMDSRLLPGTCMNCHSFPINNPDKMVFHLREFYPGTVLYSDNRLEKLNTKSGRMFGNAAFPYWHPSEKYIAFSVNKVNQIFHAIGPERAASVDLKSDIFIYDIEKNLMLTSPSISAGDNFETFPCFSPDGNTLYFCSADSVKLPEKFDSIKFSLVSVPFSSSTGIPGEKTDTIISSVAINKSISIPRISPDGRFLMFNTSDYGSFPSFNAEADLWMLDVKTGNYKSLDILNSERNESYHAWSSTGRWVVFSSRRKDGLYSNPYIAYIDEHGEAFKPFLLPQKDPSFYDTFLFSFNVPEFVKTKVLIDPYEIEKAAKRFPAVQVNSGSGH